MIEIDKDAGFINISTPFSQTLQNAIESDSNDKFVRMKMKKMNMKTTTTTNNKNHSTSTDDGNTSNDTTSNTNYDNDNTTKTHSTTTNNLNQHLHVDKTSLTSTPRHNANELLQYDDETKSQSNTKSSYSTIPPTVLQYQRQLRKVQAEQRASQPDPSLTGHIDVVYSDDHIVVVNKPSGLLSVPGLNGNPSLLKMVYDDYPPTTTTTTTTTKDYIGSGDGDVPTMMTAPTITTTTTPAVVTTDMIEMRKKNYKNKKSRKANKKMIMAHMAVHR